MGWPPGWLEVPAAALPLPAGTGGDFSLPRPHAAGPAGHVEALPIRFLLSFCTPQIFALHTGFFFLSSLQRMQKRAERFNVPVSLESKKAARAAR